jgi:hypothetical protein
MSWQHDQIHALLFGIIDDHTGRIAFRYDVPDTSTNADYIGIDSVLVNQNAPEPATLGLIAFGLGAVVLRRRFRRGSQVQF